MRNTIRRTIQPQLNHNKRHHCAQPCQCKFRKTLTQTFAQPLRNTIRRSVSTTAQPQQNRNITTVSCDRHARNHERVDPRTAKSQYYYSFVRSTRTKPREGCSAHIEIAILLQFRAIDTHETTKGLLREPAKSQYYYSFVRSTRTIHCKTQGFAQRKPDYRAAEKNT